MTQPVPEVLGVIAGKGVYPLLLAEEARRQGVKRLVAVAFRGETDRRIADKAHEVVWLRVGPLAPVIEALTTTGARQAVMAGQITPTHLFRMRMDTAMRELLQSLPVRNAETIFGAVAERLRRAGIELLPAHRFMESAMCPAGLLSRRAPSDEERSDIEFGFRVAKHVSALDVGQTVVVKRGTVLAVEAFEGTDAAIRRAARLGGPGVVVIKVAKRGHDMRFDIPVVGLHTIRSLRRARAAVLALEAGRTLVLERERMVQEADRCGICWVGVRGEPE